MPRGFTLLESVVTLSVMSLLLVWAVPNFSSVSETTKMMRLAKELNSFVLMAKSQAILRRQPLWIHLTRSGDSWTLNLTDSEDEDNGLVLMRLSGEPFTGIELATTYSSNQISFDATHGRPKSGRFTFYPELSSETVLELRTHFRSAIVRVCAPSGTALGYQPC
ncbi:pilus assembly protein FimT [Vibrio coralliilyticus]|uniref:GspH/FimT family pseudopilin n=1 Tax=Vibrio coralliilyticus TaxID=190893 RepID=UPI000BAB09BE|nr:GspH/FimT family pseudopilin [Vibrio coralliilyticus]PAU37581.1 pilus assembly protein FimT [Vibrio coralliilyticus]